MITSYGIKSTLILIFTVFQHDEIACNSVYLSTLLEKVPASEYEIKEYLEDNRVLEVDGMLLYTYVDIYINTIRFFAESRVNSAFHTTTRQPAKLKLSF